MKTKKLYVTPAININKINYDSHILADSDNRLNYSSETTSPNCVTLSRENVTSNSNGVWDEEEEEN